MKKNFTIDRRLLQYTAAAAAFLAVGPASAAVVYVDLDPDNTIAGEGAEMMIDIDADGTDDFQFIVSSFTGVVSYYGFPVSYGVKVAVANAMGDNEFVGSVQSFSGYTINYLPQLAEGATIGSATEFVTGYGTLALSVTVFGSPYYTYGNWAGAEMDYMGFRLVIDKDYYYGWMRVSVAEDASSITLHDYAYQTNANQSITAGQTTAIDEAPVLDGVQVYSFGATINIQVSADLVEAVDLKIFSLNGELVKHVHAIQQSQAIDCIELPDGNYIAELTGRMGSMSTQLFLGN